MIVPFMVLALRDALVKPMPGKPMAPSLANPDELARRLVYEFALRKGVTFHNGDPSPPTT